MKKTLVALAVAAISTTAFANVGSRNSQPSMFEFDPMHKDQFSVSGSVGVGGYYDTGTKTFSDDWVTGITLAVNYRNNAIVGYVETDLELNWTTDEDDNAFGADSNTKNEFTTDVDKAWLGLDTGYGIFSYGWENDTALDKVDGAGDFTYEFGSSAGDASDAFDVIKFQGSTGGFAYGISHFNTDEDSDVGDNGYNGYIGLEQEKFKVYAGYEDRDDALNYSVISLSGNAVITDKIGLGANFWINEDDAEKTTGYYISGEYVVSDVVTLSAGYNGKTTEIDGKPDNDKSRINVTAFYTISDRADAGIDIMRDIDAGDDADEETYVFAAAYYYF